jgi:hypothetical protein
MTYLLILVQSWAPIGIPSFTLAIHPYGRVLESKVRVRKREWEPSWPSNSKGSKENQSFTIFG